MGTFSFPCDCCDEEDPENPDADGYYLQATRCSDGVAADLWFQRNTDGTIFTTVAAHTPLPFYFEIGGVQYYVAVGSPSSGTPGTMASGYSQIPKLTCCASGKVCVFEWQVLYNRSYGTWGAVTQSARQCLDPDAVVLSPGWRYGGSFNEVGTGTQYCYFLYRQLGGCCSVAGTCGWPATPLRPTTLPPSCALCDAGMGIPRYRATLSGGTPICSDGTPYTKGTGSASGTWSNLEAGITTIPANWGIQEFDAPGCANLAAVQQTLGITRINFGSSPPEMFAEIYTVWGNNARGIFRGSARRAIPDECCRSAKLFVIPFDTTAVSEPGHGFVFSGGSLTLELTNCPY